MKATERDRQSEYVIIIPAYNEARSISRALDALEVAIEMTPHSLRRVIICLNGCTDNTATLVASRTNKAIPITTLSCQRGYRNALNRLFNHTKRYYPDARIVKVDADSIIQPDALLLMLDQLDKHQSLQIVGGHPLPLYSASLSPWRRLLARTFSLRSVYPQSQIAIADVSQYHPFHKIDPQEGIGDNESRLKPYFHGRIWTARSSHVLSNLSKDIIGDDVFLKAYIYSRFGPGAIRVLYNANVYNAPNHRMRRHWMVYRRIYEDIRRIEAMPEYTEIERAARTRLDWGYIFSEVKVSDQILFIFYWVISRLEEFSFKRTIYRESFWHYSQKENL